MASEQPQIRAKSADRPHDVVVFGATGFAGRLTAEYLARAAPPGCRWALAGRSAGKLARVRDELGVDVPLITADIGDARSLRDLAESARVVATTVGPYVLYGDGIVAACAAAGTDYLDLTGEPEFVDVTYVRHHATAQGSGARLVHAAGFDSIPHDLGTLFTVLQLPDDAPLTVSGYVRVSASFSGGTFHSLLTAASRPRQNVAAARERRAGERGTEPRDRTARARTGRPHHAPVGGGWAVPLPTIDPQIVARSARADDRYGPDFTYSHYAAVPRLPVAVGGVLGVGALVAAAQLPPARRALLGRLQPGDGPSAARRARSWFTVTFVGEGGGRRVVAKVSGGDPGYDETAKMLAESALCLAFDELPETSGQVTTATAMGEALIDRLRKAGMGFDVLS
jgi:short subunit dehydrogenase-like uncharacterized protein